MNAKMDSKTNAKENGRVCYIIFTLPLCGGQQPEGNIIKAAVSSVSFRLTKYHEFIKF